MKTSRFQSLPVVFSFGRACTLFHAARAQWNRHGRKTLPRRSILAASVVALGLVATPAEALTFSNGTSIAIPASGTGGLTTGFAAPYPSTITVSGVSGTITKVTVTLNGLGHTWPTDMDILLRGPGGQTVMLMSDAGGGLLNVISGRIVTFDDAAASSVPQNSTIASTTYKPTNYSTGGADDFTPGGGPAAPYGATLSVFNGLTANGNWDLFAFDQVGGDKGSITGGWTLNIGGNSGPLLQNSAPVGIPTFATFIVNGSVATGAPAEDNSIAGLIFAAAGGHLQISNTLFVANGPVIVPGGSSIQLGLPGGPSGNLSVNQLSLLFGALLSGNGTIMGDLFNDGTLSPGFSPGKIYVTGNYTQGRNGTLRIEIGGRHSGEHDELVVGGTAKLDGTLELVRLNNFKLKRGDKITFLTAGQGVDGEFAHVSNGFTSDTILLPEVAYGRNQVSLELVRQSFEKYAQRWELTPNQRAVAGGLDSLSAHDPNHKALVYLDNRALGQLPGDFERIAPEELTSIFTIATSQATVQNTNLQRRTDDIRSGSNGFSAAGLAINGQTPSFSGNIGFRTGAAGPTGNEIRDGKEMKESKEVAPVDNRWGAFLTGTGEWVDVKGDGNARGYDLTTGGFTLGLDYKVCSHAAIGVMAGYVGTKADLTGDGAVWVNGGKLGLYATTFIGGWYADVAVSGGLNGYDTKRSALQGTARGSTNGGELNVLAAMGYDWKIGALQIGPTASFNYTLVGIDGYTERGSLAPLNIASRNAESIRSAFGFKASYDWKLGGVIVKPELRAAWQHEYGDSSYALDATFANGGGNSFLVNGPEIGRDSLLLGAGFAIQCSERCATYLYYDGELARERFARHGVSGGVRLAF